MVLEPGAMVYEPKSMTGVMGGARVYGVWARVYGVRARFYGVRARVYGTLKILVSAPVPFGQIGFYWDLVGVLGLRFWGRGLTILKPPKMTDYWYRKNKLSLIHFKHNFLTCFCIKCFCLCESWESEDFKTVLTFTYGSFQTKVMSHQILMGISFVKLRSRSRSQVRSRSGPRSGP